MQCVGERVENYVEGVGIYTVWRNTDVCSVLERG